MAKGKKTGGREKGTPNKISLKLREKIGDYLESNFEEFVSDIKALEAKERVRAYRDLLQYQIPKPQSISIVPDLDSLTEEQIDELYNRIMHKISVGK